MNALLLCDACVCRHVCSVNCSQPLVCSISLPVICVLTSALQMLWIGNAWRSTVTGLGDRWSVRGFNFDALFGKCCGLSKLLVFVSNAHKYYQFQVLVVALISKEAHWECIPPYPKLICSLSSLVQGRTCFRGSSNFVCRCMCVCVLESEQTGVCVSMCALNHGESSVDLPFMFCDYVGASIHPRVCRVEDARWFK